MLATTVISAIAYTVTTASLVSIPFVMQPKKNKVISAFFENKKLKIESTKGSLYPTLISSTESPTHVTHVYKMPVGLSSEEINKSVGSLSEALNKDVTVTFEGGVVKIRVFKYKLPSKVDLTYSMMKPGTWEVPVAVTHDKVIYHDFDKFPHLLMGGVTRFGKTVLLQNIIDSLILSQGENVNIYIIDPKEGLEFVSYLDYPQVKAVACDIEESAVLLQRMAEMVKEKMLYFKKKRYKNIVHTAMPERHFLIVDEGAEITPDNITNEDEKKHAKKCIGYLSRITRMAGALGVRVIYATQYPVKSAVPMQIKMNIVTRISFTCAGKIASEVILDDTSAMDLDSIPGRCIYKIDRPIISQVPYGGQGFLDKHFKRDSVVKMGGSVPQSDIIEEPMGESGFMTVEEEEEYEYIFRERAQ